MTAYTMPLPAAPPPNTEIELTTLTNCAANDLRSIGLIGLFCAADELRVVCAANELGGLKYAARFQIPDSIPKLP